MPEYGFSLIRIFQYKERIKNSDYTVKHMSEKTRILTCFYTMAVQLLSHTILSEKEKDYN